MARFGTLPQIENTIRFWEKLLSGGLTFARNIRGSTSTVSIPAGKEAAVPHRLREVPKGFIITDVAGDGNLIRSGEPWDEAFIYLKNKASTSTFEGKIFILG